MNLENFLNPAGEDDEPSEEFISMYSQVPAEDSEDEEGPPTPIQLPSTTEAEQALELLLLYQEHDDETTSADIKALRKLYRRAKARKAERAVHYNILKRGVPALVDLEVAQRVSKPYRQNNK
jgi:hypothetical protein